MARGRGRGERGRGRRFEPAGLALSRGRVDQRQPCPLLFFEKKSQACSKTRSSLVLAMQHADAEPGSLLGKQKKSAADKLPV